MTEAERISGAEQPGPTADRLAGEATVAARTERRIKAAGDALRTLLRDFYESRFGSVPPRGDELTLSLRVVTRPQQAWALDFDPPLADQLALQMEDAQAGFGLYRDGRAFCYRCNQSDCEHAVPVSALSVFAGYDSTGRPEWQELAQVLATARHDRVDRLFGRPAQVLALAQWGHTLRGQQLQAFGRASKTYAVLGQVVAGYFALPGGQDAADAARRLAVTFQIVESRSAQGAFELHLNLMARPPDGQNLGALLAEGWEPSLRRAKEIAARALAGVEFRARTARDRGEREEARDALREVPRILHQLVSFIERGDRQDQRRTRHAEERRRERRPVHKALEDARRAGEGAWFYDLKARTVVACGDRNRAHAFSEAGRHVTSFLIKPAAIELRLRTERWRPLTAGERADYLSRLQEPTSSSHEEPHESP